MREIRSKGTSSGDQNSGRSLDVARSQQGSPSQEKRSPSMDTFLEKMFGEGSSPEASHSSEESDASSGASGSRRGSQSGDASSGRSSPEASHSSGESDASSGRSSPEASDASEERDASSRFRDARQRSQGPEASGSRGEYDHWMRVLKDYAADRQGYPHEGTYHDLAKQAQEALSHLKDEGYKDYALNDMLHRHIAVRAVRSQGVEVEEADLEVLADAKVVFEGGEYGELGTREYRDAAGLQEREEGVWDRLREHEGKDLSAIERYVQEHLALLGHGASQSSLLEGLKQGGSGKRKVGDASGPQEGDEERQSRSKRSRLGASSTGLTEQLGDVSMAAGNARGLEEPWTSYETEIDSFHQEIKRQLGSPQDHANDEKKLKVLIDVCGTLDQCLQAHQRFQAKQEIYNTHFQSALDEQREGLAAIERSIEDTERRRRDAQTAQRFPQGGADEMEVDEGLQARTPDTGQLPPEIDMQLETLENDKKERQGKLEKLRAEEEGYSKFRVKNPLQKQRMEELKKYVSGSVTRIFQSSPDLARFYAFQTNDTPIVSQARQFTMNSLDSTWSEVKTSLASYFQKRDCYGAISVLIHELHQKEERLAPLLLLTDVSKALSPFRELSRTVSEQWQAVVVDPTERPSFVDQLNTPSVDSAFARIMPGVDQECRRYVETLHRYCLKYKAPEDLRQHARQTVDSFQQEPRTPEDFRKRFEGVHKFLERVASWEKEAGIQVLPPRDQRDKGLSKNKSFQEIRRSPSLDGTIKNVEVPTIAVTAEMRAKYAASQADKPDAKGRKLTYTNPKTKEQRAFFIPQDEKGKFRDIDREETLAVINERGVIATIDQLHGILGKRASAKDWEVEKHGEAAIQVTEALHAKYAASQAKQSDAKGRKLTYTNPVTKEQRAFFIPRDEKGKFGDKEEILAVINEKGVIAIYRQLEHMLGKRAYAEDWEVEKHGEAAIQVTEALRAKYAASQADKPDARGRKLTYTNPVTKEQRAFFIPRDEKGKFGDKEEILAVINERGVIATIDQLGHMLVKRAFTKDWEVEKHGEAAIQVTAEMHAKYDASQADKPDAKGRKLTYTNPATKEKTAFFIPQDKKGKFRDIDREEILAVINEGGVIATIDQLGHMLGKEASAKHWKVEKHGEAAIEVTEALRAKYAASQAKQSGAKGRKLTYTNPDTKEQSAFFIPQDKKGKLRDIDREDILAVINERGVIATIDQLGHMLGKEASAKYWEVEEYGEKITVTDEMRAKYDVSQAGKPDARGRKLTYTNPKTKEQSAFFIPQDEKGKFIDIDREETLAVINERGVIATIDQLGHMLGKRASARCWKVEKYGEVST